MVYFPLIIIDFFWFICWRLHLFFPRIFADFFALISADGSWDD